MHMNLSIIVAMGRNRVIGKDNGLPWRLPADLKHFKNVTLGHPVLMGRKTFESIGRPLPGRTNIVITRQKNYKPEGCLMAGSIQEALALAQDADEAFVIGGASIFEKTIPLAWRLYVTLIDHEFEGDTLFSGIDPSLWVEKERQSFRADNENPYGFSFLVFERVGSDSPV